MPHQKTITITPILTVACPLKLCCLNTRSIKNKTSDFVDYVVTSKADLFAVTETWFTEMDVAHKTQATLPGWITHERTVLGVVLFYYTEITFMLRKLLLERNILLIFQNGLYNIVRIDFGW